MAKIKISELQETTNVKDAYAPVEQNGSNRKVNLGGLMKSIIINYDELDGNLPSNVVEKLKTNEYALFAKWNSNYPYHMIPISYIYSNNEWKLSFLTPPNNRNTEYQRLVLFAYNESGVKVDGPKYLIFSTNGDGTKFLNDKGEYVEVSAGGGGTIKTIPPLYSSKIKYPRPTIAVSQPPYTLSDLSYGVEGYQRIGFIGNFNATNLYLFRLTAKPTRAQSSNDLLSTTGWSPVYSYTLKKSNPDEENRVHAIFRGGNNIFPSKENEYHQSFYDLTLKEIFLHNDNFLLQKEILIPRLTKLEDFIIKMYVRQKITSNGNILTWFSGNHARPICHTDTERGNKDRWIRQWFGLSASPDGTDMRKFYCAIGVVGNDHAKCNVMHRSPYGALCITFRVRG